MEQSEPEATKTNEPKAKLMMEQTASSKHTPTQKCALSKTREITSWPPNVQACLRVQRTRIRADALRALLAGRAQVRAAPRCAMRVVFSRCGPPEVRILVAAAAVKGGARRRARGALGLGPSWAGCALLGLCVPQEKSAANEGTLTTQQVGFALTRQNVHVKTASLHA